MTKTLLHLGQGLLLVVVVAAEVLGIQTGGLQVGSVHAVEAGDRRPRGRSG